MAKTIEELRKENICTRCGAKLTDGKHAQCFKCRVYATDYYYRKRRKAKK